MPSTHLGPGVSILVPVYPGRVNTPWWERLLPSIRGNQELKRSDGTAVWIAYLFCTELQNTGQ